MDKTKSTIAQQIAQAAIAFEQQQTGNGGPKSVTVVLSEGTLVITLHEALSPAKKELAKSPAGAAQVQERFALACFVIALVAAVFGFAGAEEYSFEGAKIVFAIFLVLALLSSLGGTYGSSRA